MSQIGILNGGHRELKGYHSYRKEIEDRLGMVVLAFNLKGKQISEFQASLQREFQDSQGYTENSCVEMKEGRKEERRLC